MEQPFLIKLLPKRLETSNANNKNFISIIIPCHRVIGSKGELVGYAGGLNKKAFLLQLEQQNQHNKSASLFKEDDFFK